ncbi:hypothetical protein H7X46_07600 [Pseudonocardia sp. C8]|uniref:hypothetical protein n=1 Tax=Pseudonocardia sp. C8 TaxID=2762759 RepID=UPI0016430A23|nr:hypothetical protein [Pseudonocardia sp. C8]MBC3190925.1 hypothetical protein [Pseudonocardia sp. C8]
MPPPEGRADRPATVELETSMHTTARRHDRTAVGCELADDLVDLADLVCPGCWGPVVDVPPVGWPVRAGRVPGFSHPDGSVLCPDEQGRAGEPIEAGGLCYGLTEAGAVVSVDEARWSW